MSAAMGKVEQNSVSEADRERLERQIRDRNTPPEGVLAARIVLLASDGLTATAIAAAADKSVLMVRRWRRRYAANSRFRVTRLRRQAGGRGWALSRS